MQISKAGRRATPIDPHRQEIIDQLLATVRAHLGMDLAFVSEFVGSERVFRSVDGQAGAFALAKGTAMPIGSGYCRLVASGELPQLIADTRAVPRAMSLPETLSMPIGAHLSVPIELEPGEIFGTFCCLSHAARPDLNDGDLNLMRKLGRLVAAALSPDAAHEADRFRLRQSVTAAVAAGDPAIVFQPVRRLADGYMTGVEALSRFASQPKRSPDLWFADAEQCGLGATLELLAARKAIEAARDLPEHLTVNINVSPATLVSTDVCADLRGIAPERLVIEITEHVPIEDYTPIVEALRPLRDRGMRIAIDDAGAGFSSLRHILLLRPDIIKLDVSLTRGIDKDPLRIAMIGALGQFSEQTGVRVVAEGVETQEELETLRTLKIEKGQGYLLGRPQAVEQLLQSLAGTNTLP